MKNLYLILVSLFVFSTSLAGGTGSTSTGGTRPTPNNFSLHLESVEMVKFRNVRGKQVEFYFKDKSRQTPDLYQVNIEEIRGRYIEALKKSEAAKTWEIVPEGIEE
ncbi:hypothetical protein [Bdellovibrio sp.]|uniref:hypothetical protein n=1 Tax=Bdellovibrio sp. TaxID=28201 RepID=UPI0039E67A10